MLGAGVALLFKHFLSGSCSAFPNHSGVPCTPSAMYEKHRLDTSGQTVVPRWTGWTYWLCWMLLLGLVAYVWRAQS